MKITNANLIKNNINFQKSAPITSIKTADKVALPNSNYTAQNIKANFMPITFGSSKKIIGKTEITDRKTGKKLNATIKEDSVGDFKHITMSIKGKELGYIDLETPCGKYAYPGITSSEKKCTEISHLRSLEGEQYKGIGTKLIKVAVQTAIKNDCADEIWLCAEKGYASGLSKYKANESPIPFYYKTGFEAFHEPIDKSIKRALNKGDFRTLPDSAILLLTPEAKKAMTKEFIENPIIKTK